MATSCESDAASLAQGKLATHSIHPRVLPYAGACSVILRNLRSSLVACFKTSSGGEASCRRRWSWSRSSSPSAPPPSASPSSSRIACICCRRRYSRCVLDSRPSTFLAMSVVTSSCPRCASTSDSAFRIRSFGHVVLRSSNRASNESSNAATKRSASLCAGADSSIDLSRLAWPLRRSSRSTSSRARSLNEAATDSSSGSSSGSPPAPPFSWTPLPAASSCRTSATMNGCTAVSLSTANLQRPSSSRV
mmetsp:Transcript_9354/g.42575  ORF Transcript_9354/g.42575 Transcript_9354/m.42575 type:complete len:248 (-) Transcript_9354:687-1430(-)